MNIKKFSILIIVGTVVISCTTKKEKEGGLIESLWKTDTLTLYAQYSECGEWGGHEEFFKIYRGDNDDLWTKYQRDSVISCEGPIENNRRVSAKQTIQLDALKQKEIIRYLHDLLDRSLEARKPSHFGEYFSVFNGDSTLVISRTVHGYKEFSKLRDKIIK